MEKAQYAIMRFAKYKGPEIGNIEAHNERTKEKYASSPMGLPLAAIWLLGKVQSLKFAIQDWVYG